MASQNSEPTSVAGKLRAGQVSSLIITEDRQMIPDGDFAERTAKYNFDDVQSCTEGGVMVWGMSLPSSFGEFFLEGNFEGEVSDHSRSRWDDRLNHYYYTELSPEKQKAVFAGGPGTSYVSYVAGKLIGEIGTKKGPDYPPFDAIAAHEPPRSFMLARGGKAIGSLFTPGDRILVVEEALKAIIERLEPGVHQFFPISIKRRNGEQYPNSYYILVIGQYFDSFSREKSLDGSFRDYGPEYPNSYEPPRNDATIKGLAFVKAKFGNAHLWRDRSFKEWLTCFSDELISEAAKADLHLPKHYRMMEV